ncbi:2-isopropylmalate synthase [Pelomyxa schiedti]|nr:2-isopropylmalate synthase [Pelomyxa schiedti]
MLGTFSIMATAAPPPGGTTMMVVDHSVANNGAYTGRLVDNQRDGKGTCTWQNGQTFYGDWKYDNMHGRGMYTWLDGDSHTGEWRNDKRDGWGVSRRADGWSFEGLFRDDSWKRGSWHSPAKAYEGEWAWNEAASEHQLHGWGVQRGTQPNENALMMETVYEGEWDRGQWHGSGTWRSPDGSGDMYHGVFEHGKRSGNGRMLFGGENSHGGGSYVGEWKDDKFHGLGVRLWANGDRYVGQWLCGKENGEGAMRWACDGSSFDGVWEGGAVRSGTMKWPNGDQFSGTFRGDGVGEGIATVKSCDSSTTSKFEGTVTSGIFQEHGNGGVRHHMGCGDLLMEVHYLSSFPLLT